MTSPAVGRSLPEAPAGQSLPEMVVPAYQSTTLGELMPSIGAHLGVPGCREDVYGLPPSARYVVVLIDGLGWNLLRRAVLEAPFLASLLGGAQPITSAVPSTTVTSLGSLGTGQPPGQHGLVGYTSRVPATGEILNGLTWESDLVPTVYQSKPTFFERASGAGVAVTSVALARFQGTGLTEAALRGAAFVPFSDESAEELRIALIAEAAWRGDRSVVYAYERELDHYGHVHGCNSADWLQQLARIDAMCERLRAALPPQVTMIITGDHGMVDIPSEQRIVAEDDPALMAGSRHLPERPASASSMLIKNPPVGWRTDGVRGLASLLGYGPGTRRSTKAGSPRSMISSGSVGVMCWWPFVATGRS